MINMKPAAIILAGFLAAAAPSSSDASHGRTWVVKPTGTVDMKVLGDGVNASGTLKVIAGRVEIVEGDYEPWRGKHFLLTRFIVRLDSFYVTSTSLGRMDFDHVGIQLRSALRWYGQDVSTLPGIKGKYSIEIPEGDARIFGDPVAQGTAFVTNKGERKLFGLADRIVGPLTGVVDFDAHTLKLHFVIEGREAAPWWAPWRDDTVHRFTVAVSGALEEPGLLKPDPPLPGEGGDGKPPEPVRVGPAPVKPAQRD